MDLISSLFSGMLAKVAPIILILLALSMAANYLQADRLDKLSVENQLIKQRLGDVIAENQALSALVERRKQERDMNQHLVDQLNQDNHKLLQQASQTQTQVRTVIQYEQCSHTAIPDDAIERMREQYQSSDSVQNDRAQTTTQSD